jgi:hypothetical protein
MLRSQNGRERLTLRSTTSCSFDPNDDYGRMITSFGDAPASIQIVMVELSSQPEGDQARSLERPLCGPAEKISLFHSISLRNYNSDPLSVLQLQNSL